MNLQAFFNQIRLKASMVELQSGIQPLIMFFKNF